ncbi:putative TRAFAC class myosin-kinesin ATPase superfamily, kinesin family protein [Lyophyllum shimeji]|uniref:Kinesin-like protein n=1 Tax=Lyophyllum shimeji TaxID=47721 RepID=A0A9P3PWR1_LYOSH|nr:putative TRAFAC class myosin-kinesin ATPase superfamily, kinesin family protein [Lyophyllum shimeji]
MSRLPRLHSSPTQPTAGPSGPTLKRKAAEEDDEARDQPRKLPAIGARDRPSRTLQPSRTTPNLAKSSSSSLTTSGPKPAPTTKLTVPRAPNLTTRHTRGTSAPPATRPAAPPARPRAVSGRSGSSDDKRFSQLQTQLTSLESARAADAARLAQDMEAERAKVAELQANHAALSRELVAARNHELNQRRELVHFSDEIEMLKKKHAREVMDLEMDVKQKAREAREVSEDLRLCRGDLEREREAVNALKATLAMQSTAHLTLTTQNQLLQAQVEAQTREIAQLTAKLEEAERMVEEMRQEVRDGEIVRRKLHNMVQELKGNIRVFCRVRPVLPSDSDEEAKITFPDKREHKEIVLESSSESATGQERKEVYNFGFDKVFEPRATQAEVFEEISQLAQSCTDGYNVCIFAYGQTGSGKSYTMEGGPTEQDAGMIPRAVDQVFRVAEQMKSKGWEYTMEGQFLEIYNETINDLLGAHDFDKKKHEIKHDARTGTTRVTDLTVVPLHSAAQVRALLQLAQKRRSVAATLVNERSSRSHSVFTLRIRGACPGAKEECEGSLNLVDLAGSERLNVSFANGAERERVKETQSINKSLSALGDVIAALGERGAGGAGAEGKHIPYRNSKLTYLLQNSLSGNSKTLMFLNLSPLASHLNESLTSLRFATKVNNTTIGTAKKQARTS